MEKNINEYIKYYLGSDCVNSWFPDDHEQHDKNWKIVGIDLTIDKPFQIENDDEYVYTSSVKPKLRRLESMTEEERKELDETKAFQRATPVHQINIRVWTAESYHWALKKGFDLFDLIREGLAIEKQPATV